MNCIARNVQKYALLFAVICLASCEVDDNDQQSIADSGTDLELPNDVDMATKPEPEVHREIAMSCNDFRPTGSGDGVSGDYEEQNCDKDADCYDGRNGRCTLIYFLGPPEGKFCTYDDCLVDDVCESGSVCLW